MSLQEYIQSREVQDWAAAQGFARFILYPTGDPMVEKDGKTFVSAVSLEDFHSALKDAVNSNSPLPEGTLEEEPPIDPNDFIVPVI